MAMTRQEVMEDKLQQVRDAIDTLGKSLSLDEYIRFVDEIACHCIALSGAAKGE